MAAPEPESVTFFEEPKAFRAWLETHHEIRDALWVGYWRKSTDRPSVTWEDTVDVALCFGWIDGIRRRLDSESYCIRFTPRRRGSSWSRRNEERYAAMLDAGLVGEAGASAFAARTEAKRRTASHERTRPAELSDDFEARLRAHPDAWSDWAERPPSYRRRVAHWVMSARKPETRERRLTKLIEDLEAGVA